MIYLRRDVTRLKTRILRSTLNVLAFLALFFLFLYRNYTFSTVFAGICFLLSAIILFMSIPSIYRNSLDSSGIKTLRGVTVFNILTILAVVAYIILSQTKTIQISDEQESTLAAMFLAVIVFALGNICPRLPFSRYTGLRLPWTVADEDTWTVAHRLLGYCSYPIGLCILVTCFINILSATRNFICVTLFLLWIAIPAIISFSFFRRKAK